MDYLENIRCKEEFLEQVDKLEEVLFNSELLRQQGWTIDQRRARSPKLPKKIGLVTYKRRRWRNSLTGEKKFLVDELLGLERRIIIHSEIKDEIRYWLKEGSNPKDIIKVIEKYFKVRVSKTTVSKLANQEIGKLGCPYYEKEKQKLVEGRNWLYLQMDESDLKYRGKGREIKKWYGRVASVYTGWVEGVKKTKSKTRVRNMRIGTRCFCRDVPKRN